MSDAPKSPIAYKPTEGLSYDPEEPKYWDAKGLAAEIERTFEICHGCRLCFKYCDSFPKLFSLIDEAHGGDVRAITGAETESVLDDCFQCKLCEVQCPYTVREGHEFALDFPALVHRSRAQRARREGLSVRDRVLGDPDRAGAAARASLGIADAANRNAAHRWCLEKAVGIDRRSLLPPFARESFERWATKNGKIGEPGGEVALFQTCYVQHNEPEIGRDTVEVLEKNGVDVRCVRGLECCGMPAWEHGDLETLRKKAKRNLERLIPFVERGAKVVAINPTCSMMLRREYPKLLEGKDRAAAERLAAVVADPGEFLWSIRAEPRFSADFKSAPSGPIAYHAPCHLRAQGVGFKGRDVLRKLGVSVSTTMECSGHDGTYAMTVEGFEPSIRIGKKAFDGLKEGEASVWATDCPLAALQFEQHAGKKALHPMTILARAYRGEPFEAEPPGKKPR